MIAGLSTNCWYVTACSKNSSVGEKKKKKKQIFIEDSSWSAKFDPEDTTHKKNKKIGSHFGMYFYCAKFCESNFFLS